MVCYVNPCHQNIVLSVQIKAFKESRVVGVDILQLANWGVGVIIPSRKMNSSGKLIRGSP